MTPVIVPIICRLVSVWKLPPAGFARSVAAMLSPVAQFRIVCPIKTIVPAIVPCIAPPGMGR
jgi:hypothetical protein